MAAPHKSLIVALLLAAAGLGVGIYQARRASALQAKVQRLETRLAEATESASNLETSSLQAKIRALETQASDLTEAVVRANTEKTRLQTEREQARQSAATLYQELAAQGGSTDGDLTNQYPSARHVWAAFGRLGRLTALAKQDESRFSPDEKAALEAAKIKALEELPGLVKAAKLYEATQPEGTDAEQERELDSIACLLYGALNLDQQQFGQVYGLMEKLMADAKQKAGAQAGTGQDQAETLKELTAQFQSEIQPFLSPEQAGIFAEVLTHMKFEPGNFTFNFNF